MSTLTGKTQPKENTLFRSNPVLKRLSKVTERAAGNVATYSGIATKTCFFLALTLVGMLAQLLVHAAFANQPVWQTFEIYKSFTVSLTLSETIVLVAVMLGGFVMELLGIFVRKTIPVTGSLYAMSEGYVISFIVFRVLKGYEYLGMEALLITIAVIGVMSWLYSAGIIKANKKFHAILLALVLGSIALGVLTFAGSLIPATRPYVQAMMQNTALTIGLDVIGIVIAALFLISDFSTIDTCVRDGYPKEYEWSAAFGLVFTVLWLYVKILDLLIQLAGKKKD